MCDDGGGGGGTGIDVIDDAWDKADEGVSDLARGIREDPLRVAGYMFPMFSGGLQPSRDAGVHLRDDQRAQAEGEAAKEQARSDEAVVRAKDRAPKSVDELASERRRRGATSGTKGRAGSILTGPGGQSLGAADIATKTLLGL